MENTVYYYLIRHGETDWNVERRMQGREDVPLNEKGRLQASELARALAGVPFSLIMTSPLFRAAETAAAIRRYHPGVRIVEDPLLMERDKGRVSGLTPEEREAFLASGGSEDQEPIASVRERGRRALEHCRELLASAASGRAASTPGKDVHVAVVTHGGLIYHLLNSISEDALNGPSGRKKLRNASLCILKNEEEVLAVDIAAEEFGRYWEGSSE